MDTQNNQHHQGEPVELFISARGLKNLNNLYQSDPQCYVYMNHGHDEHSNLLGHTEAVKHNLNPDFKDTIKANYTFHQRQVLSFQVYDSNSSVISHLTELAISGEKKQSYIGNCTISLGELMSAKNCTSKLRLIGPDGIQETGNLIVYIDKVREQSQTTSIRWQWGAHKLLKMDCFGKSDPFAKFYKFTTNKERILVYQTEVIKKTLEPTWKVWETTAEKLCQNDDNFFVEVWDYDHIGGHDLIGTITIDLGQIIQHNKTEFDLISTKNKYAGTIKLLSKTVSIPPPIRTEITFLDYLRGGWQLSMLAGLDFTFSNGPLNRPNSLHELKADSLNYYQQALKYVGSVIIAYDSDKQVPLYGFGGVPKLPNYTKPYAEDCFPLNGNPENPQCNDIGGLLDVYAKAVPKIEFSGPTFVAKILRNAVQMAEKNAQNDTYTVVLCITDGQIEDMEDTFAAIVDACEFPISIIIIGVGDDDFSYMHKLDNVDEVRKHAKTDQKKDCVRDVVQFVDFKAFHNDIEKLTETILDHLPKQFMDYMRIHNKKPKEIQKAHMSMIAL